MVLISGCTKQELPTINAEFGVTSHQLNLRHSFLRYKLGSASLASINKVATRSRIRMHGSRAYINLIQVTTTIRAIKALRDDTFIPQSNSGYHISDFMQIELTANS